MQMLQLGLAYLKSQMMKHFQNSTEYNKPIGCESDSNGLPMAAQLTTLACTKGRTYFTPSSLLPVEQYAIEGPSLAGYKAGRP